MRTALAEVYAWYARNQDAIGRALRDGELVPVGGGVRRLQAAVLKVLGGNHPARQAATSMVIDFGAWQALSRRGKRSPKPTAELAARMVEAAGSTL